ncbi:MAG: hypothetical protein KDC38_05250, partial [Planctomycetes bacterium]|nr:hypothetical protein [Planctomycetota bacterium]
MRRLIVALCLLSCGTARLLAVDPVVPISVQYAYEIPIRNHGTPTDPAITRTIAGRFDLDYDVDCVVLQDDTPVLYSGPGLYDAPIQYPAAASGVVDIACKRAGVDGAELLTVGPAGLIGWQWDGTQFVERQIGPAGDWGNVTLLRTADLNVGGGADIIGYRFQGGVNQIVILKDEGQPEETMSVFNCGRAPLDIVPFVRSSGDVQIAVLTTLGVGIYAQNGDLLDAFIRVAPAGTLVAVNQGQPRDDLVWTYRTGGTDKLQVIENDGTDLALSGVVLDLGDLGVVSARAGDLDQNGADDVVLNHTQSFAVEVLLSDGNGYSLDPNHHQSHLLVAAAGTGDASANAGWIELSDFDSDGDLDVFAPASGDHVVHIMENGHVNGASLQPAIADMLFGWSVDGFDSSYIRVIFETPSLTGPLATATHIELVRWRKPLIPTATEVVGHRFLAEANQEYPMIFALLDEDER